MALRIFQDAVHQDGEPRLELQGIAPCAQIAREARQTRKQRRIEPLRHAKVRYPRCARFLRAPDEFVALYKESEEVRWPALGQYAVSFPGFHERGRAVIDHMSLPAIHPRSCHRRTSTQQIPLVTNAPITGGGVW